MRSVGLLKPFGHIPNEIWVALADAFARHNAVVYGFQVKNPGLELLRQLEDEDLLGDEVVQAFQKRLIEVYDASKLTNFPITSYCCPHHKSKFEELRGKVPAELPKYIATLLELIANREILAQLPLSAEDLLKCCSDGRLSRLIRMDTFLKEHLGVERGKVHESVFSQKAVELASLLDPVLPVAVRQAALKNELKHLSGRIGLYRLPDGVDVERLYACEETLTFSTFSESIENNGFKRTEPPDDLLLNLGLPFRPGDLYIEAIFPLKSAGCRFVLNNFVGSIPSAIEARGFWPFKVDRTGHAHGHARNLKDGGRGLPEIVHDCVPVTDLIDAIIWTKPTRNGWGEGSTLVF